MIIPLTEVIATLAGREIYRQALPPGDYEIGRELDSQIRLNADRISRRHARLTLNYFDWLIEDLGSANGTHVSGKAISEPTLVFPQQEVRVGNVKLQLQRVENDNPNESLAPQAMVALHYLPPELRDERKYNIKGMIAMGGMGVVLEAEDRATRRMVAMKTLLSTDSVENVARFVEEAQITAQLEHPNIVPVYELNVNEQDKPFYTMRLVRGESLKQVLHGLRLERPETQQRYPLQELLTIFLKVSDAIGYAHSKGVVHRDLKPENIMLGDFGEVLVMDWGLAKPLGQSANSHASDASVRTMVGSSRQDDPGGIGTVPGTAIGTPQFMSPEQASGRSHAVDARADVYALGAILYNILTLQPPVDGTDDREILEKVVAGLITPPDEAIGSRSMPHLPANRLPDPLVKIAMKAMSLRVEDRHATVRELQEELRAFQFGALKRAGLFGVERLFGGR